MIFSKIIDIILKDAKVYLDYRNKTYNLNIKWPLKRKHQIKYTFSLFRNNANGFRDLCYYRLKKEYFKIKGIYRIVRLLQRKYKPTSNLILDVGKIEPRGCIFHHPFSTFINAEAIAKNCTFRNNTTIGNKIINGISYRPIFEENVFVDPNAVIIGKIRIGKNSIIGAGAVVVKDVPPNSVVAGNPAKIIKYSIP